MLEGHLEYHFLTLWSKAILWLRWPKGLIYSSYNTWRMRWWSSVCFNDVQFQFRHWDWNRISRMFRDWEIGIGIKLKTKSVFSGVELELNIIGPESEFNWNHFCRNCISLVSLYVTSALPMGFPPDSHVYKLISSYSMMRGISNGIALQSGHLH